MRGMFVNYDHPSPPQNGQESKGLFTSWTMKSSLDPLKHVIGHWTHPKPTLVYEKKQNVRVTKRPTFKLTLCIVMVQPVLQWEKQKRFSHYKYQGNHFQRNAVLFWLPNASIITWKGGGNKHGRRSNMHIIPMLGHIFMVHGHFSWSTIGLHLVMGP